MRVGVIGINHKQAGLELRGLLASVCTRRFTPGQSLHPHHAIIPLSTCNRTEIYFSSSNLAETHSHLLAIMKREIPCDFEQKLYSFFGIDCFLHLSRVAGGLDSALIGETEIQGQVRTSYETAKLSASLPKELHFLFQKALKNGKLLRSLLPKRAEGIEELIFSIGKERAGELSQIKVLVIGASQINLKILRYLKQRKVQLTLMNRTEEKGVKLANELEIPFLPLSALSSWKEFDWIISGTKAATPLLTLTEKEALPSPKLLFDLSVPRNIAGSNRHATLFHIDDLHQKLKGESPHLLIERAEENLEKTALRQLEGRFEKVQILELALSH